MTSRAAIRINVDREAEQQRYLAYRIRILPQQLDAAQRKLAALENEARRLGMADLIKNPEQGNGTR